MYKRIIRIGIVIQLVDMEAERHNERSRMGERLVDFIREGNVEKAMAAARSIGKEELNEIIRIETMNAHGGKDAMPHMVLSNLTRRP